MRYTIASYRKDVERQLGWQFHEVWHKDIADSLYGRGERDPKVAADRIRAAEDSRKPFMVPR